MNGFQTYATVHLVNCTPLGLQKNYTLYKFTWKYILGILCKSLNMKQYFWNIILMLETKFKYSLWIKIDLCNLFYIVHCTSNVFNYQTSKTYQEVRSWMCLEWPHPFPIRSPVHFWLQSPLSQSDPLGCDSLSLEHKIQVFCFIKTYCKLLHIYCKLNSNLNIN